MEISLRSGKDLNDKTPKTNKVVYVELVPQPVAKNLGKCEYPKIKIF